MEKITLNLKIENITQEQAVMIVEMLKEAERYGAIGHSAYVGMYADGDGNFHPKVNHDLNYTVDEIREMRDTACVYESSNRAHNFPWSDSIALFDFDKLNLHK